MEATKMSIDKGMDKEDVVDIYVFVYAHIMEYYSAIKNKNANKLSDQIRSVAQSCPTLFNPNEELMVLNCGVGKDS